MIRLVDDIRISLPILARSPTYALASVLTRALGLRGTMAVFSVVDRVVLE